MDDAARTPDLAPGAERASVPQIVQLLEALERRLSRLERAEAGRESAASRFSGDAEATRQALDIFQEILSIPASGLPAAELFALAMDRVSRLLAADRTMLFVGEGGGMRLVPRSGRGFRREDLDRIVLAPGEGIIGRVFAEKRVLIWSATESDASGDPFIERFPVQDALAVPVRAEGEVAGVLFAGRRGLGVPFGTSDILLLLVLADRIGAALAEEGLRDRRGVALTRLRQLSRFAGEALAGRRREEILGLGCQAGAHLVGVPAAAVALRDESGALRVGAAWGLPDAARGALVEPDRGITAETLAARMGQCPDLRSRPEEGPDFLAAAGISGCLALPLIVRDRVGGVLWLADTAPREFSAEEIEAAHVFTSVLAGALEGARLYGEVARAVEELQAAQERRVETETARVLGVMAGGIAREFNNIFAIILGKAQLMLARTHDDSIREGLGMLEEAAWRGADIVHRLLGLAAAGMDDASGPVDLPAVVQDAVELTRPRWKDEAESHGARIEMDLRLEVSPAVHANPTALREAVMNLILNAVDAMPRGGQLHIAVGPHDRGVQLTLADTGEGIPDDVRPRIFDPFFSTRGSGRLGLGLAVVHGIVMRYQGRIEVASRPGAGTAFTVWLPGVESATPAPSIPAPAREREALPAPAPAMPTAREPAAPLAAAPEAPPPPETARTPRTASVLVIEEEEQIRAMLADALGHAGHKVEAVAEAADGLARLESARFDMVLTDLTLGQRSGLEVARTVRAMAPGTPVVLITGWGHLLDSARLRSSGVDLVLVKPFRLERVLSVVAEALRLRGSSSPSA
ncbi:MAG TPA: GAF domain-containing protein [Methylomirabilota bacterium]|nr:GAF domain-containing protein [Methylomirabilota bacterium]